MGTRLGRTVRDTPKPLLKVAGEPFLDHQLRLLSRYGARDVVLCVGYLGDRIEQALGRHRFGLRIAYSYDGPVLAGTLGAVRGAAEMLGPRFLVLYGDTYLRLDYLAAAQAWEASGRLALMTVLRNHGRWDTSNAVVRGSAVTLYDKAQPTDEMEWIDYGLGGLRREALDLVGERETDLAALYNVLSIRDELFGFPVSERFYDIGNPDALAETERFLLGLEDSQPQAPPVDGA